MTQAELVERLAARLAPNLFSADPHIAHKAASPFSVESQREGVRIRAREIFGILVEPEFQAALAVLSNREEASA